ncbi:MAG: DUF5624 domain-containing protein [Burkholderiales bacterium]|nr:DUF5624 domain-containing protein [Burkholderiales bacterium]
MIDHDRYRPGDAFHRLFAAFTSDAFSMGKHLADALMKDRGDDPLFVTTGTEMIIFPGGGREPVIRSFRKSTRGFIELTAVSHLPCAIAWMMRMRELGYEVWRKDAHYLIEQLADVRKQNSEQYWREHVDVPAYRGIEAKIADLIDYTCVVTTAFVRRELASEKGISFAELRAHYLDPVASPQVPVPMNDMMGATFGLAFLDIGHRIIDWLRSEDMDWTRTMVLITGRTGRATSGFTWATNNMCHLIWQASGQKLPPENLHIAPHAPSLVIRDNMEPDEFVEIEEQYRWSYARTLAGLELAPRMFEGYPQYRSPVEERLFIDPGTTTVDQMPSLRSMDDRRAMVTRLRMVLEDPAQLISNAAAHFVIDQLCENGNRPDKVVLPGFTHMDYPHAFVPPF